MKKILIFTVLLVLAGVYIFFSNNKIIDNDDKIEDKDITWEEITANGVNEELLVKNTDKNILTEVSTELQALVAEAYEEERENPEILITEGGLEFLIMRNLKK